MKGLFITFEGGEGSGKSSNVDKLSEWMSERGLAHETTKEPGCPHLVECQKIRELVLDPKNNIAERAELLLFLADRAQHVQKFIQPKLNQGIHIICDRYIHSTIVYQGARGLSRQKINTLIDFTIGSLLPDLTFILDVPVEVGLARAKAKSIYKEGDRMEMAGVQFHEDVRHEFLKIAENPKESRFYIVNAAPPKTINEVHQEVVEEVSRRLWTRS